MVNNKQAEDQSQTLDEIDLIRIYNRIDQLMFEYSLLSIKVDEILLKIEQKRKERS